MVGAVVGKGLVIKLERKAHKLCLWVKSQKHPKGAGAG